MEERTKRVSSVLRRGVETEKMAANRRLAKIYYSIVHVLRLCFYTFVYDRTKQYRSMKEFIIGNDCLREHTNIPQSTSESGEELDIEALFTIATEGNILKPCEMRDHSYNSNVPGTLLDWVCHVWKRILHRKFECMHEEQYREVMDDFIEIADRFEKLNNQPDKYVKEVIAIDKGEMELKDVEQILIEYRKKCVKSQASLEMLLKSGNLLKQDDEMDDQTRFAKIYCMLVDVLRPAICKFLDERIMPYASIKEFINAKCCLQNNRYLPLSGVESTFDLDISALYAIATESDILKPIEKRDHSHNQQVPGNVILWITDIWEHILYMQIDEITFVNKQKYEEHIADFLTIASQFEEFNNEEEGKYAENIKSIHERNMSVEEVCKTLDDYHKSCLILLSPKKCVHRANYKQEYPDDREAEIMFAKSYLILMDVIKLAICNCMDLKLERLNHSMKTFIEHENWLCRDTWLQKAVKKMNSTEDLDISALCIIAKKSNLVKSNAKDLINEVSNVRNEIVHSPYPRLTANEYTCYLNQFERIARGFEKTNSQNGIYMKKIDRIKTEMMNENRVKTVIENYQSYCREILKWIIIEKNIETDEEQRLRNQVSELQNKARNLERRLKDMESDTYTKDFASRAANSTDFAPAQAVFGAVGGVVGLAADLFTFGKKN